MQSSNMTESCRIQMDGGILDIGTRYAIYGTAALTMGLGALAIFSVKESINGLGDLNNSNLSQLQIDKRLDDEMYANIREHKRAIRPVSTTLNLTGIALVGAAFVINSQPIQLYVEAQEANPELHSNTQGPFTLFHAYTLLSLLWLITLTGLMIHVHTWLFNVIRRQRQVRLHSTRRFVNSIWNGTHWYLLQVELLGIYGYYVCTHRDSFPPPPCEMTVFNNSGFRMFAKIIYIIAMIPVVNIGLLCMVLVGSVWLLSLIATYLSSQQTSARSISPLVFHFFWFLTCGTIALVMCATTEVLLFTNTNSQNMWTFGSLLAFILLLVPAETFVCELYSIIVSERFRRKMKTHLGTHRSESTDGLLNSQSTTPMSLSTSSLSSTPDTRYKGTREYFV